MPVACESWGLGIDEVIHTAIDFCRGCEGLATLSIGDVPTRPQRFPAPPLTIVGTDNSGGGMFSFLLMAQHWGAFFILF